MAPLVMGRGADRAARVPGVTGAVSVAAGERHACAATMGGDVFCWGANLNGQAGPLAPGCTAEGDACRRDPPGVVPGVSGARAVAAGARHSCALLASGELRCWGSNQNGQVGVSGGSLDEPPRLVPLPVPVTSVTAGVFHTCALAGDGTAYCWGFNLWGQVGR
jgi:alpha-tubulin suppressor-like RCC1 family protein